MLNNLLSAFNLLSSLPIQKRQLFAACTAAAVSSVAAIPGFAAEKSESSSARQRVAVVYVSKTGNTQSLAECVAAFTGADLFAVETVDPYPEAYRETTEIVKNEIENNIVRPIKPVNMNPKDYDVIILMTPTWWHHVSRPLRTWIESVDLTNAFILTANTHGGGGLMHTREDFESFLPKSRLGTHFTVYGSVRRGNSSVRRWLEENKVTIR